MSNGSTLSSFVLWSHFFPMSFIICAFSYWANHNDSFGYHLMTSKAVCSIQTFLPISADLYMQMLTQHLHLDILVYLKFKLSRTKILLFPFSKLFLWVLGSLGKWHHYSLVHWIHAQESLSVPSFFHALPSQNVHKVIMTFISFKVFQIVSFPFKSQ